MWEEFPPISTAEWEATIRADLKGADYAKKLVWQALINWTNSARFRRLRIRPSASTQSRISTWRRVPGASHP